MGPCVSVAHAVASPWQGPESPPALPSDAPPPIPPPLSAPRLPWPPASMTSGLTELHATTIAASGRTRTHGELLRDAPDGIGSPPSVSLSGRVESADRAPSTVRPGAL